jgi:hypothetical protein
MRFARRDVKDHNTFHKNDPGSSERRSEHCSGRNVETSAFARFWEPFDFRLFQQCLPTADPGTNWPPGWGLRTLTPRAQSGRKRRDHGAPS